MRIICITLNDEYNSMYGDATGTSSTSRTSRARHHFAERNVDAQFYYGLHAPKLGIDTTLPYEVDVPGSGFKMGPKPTGCWLSHRTLWSACLLLPDDLFFILEDDAKFPEDWRVRVDQAVLDAGDFDLLYIGSCCTEGKPTRHIAGNVYEVRWPVCMHGYIVRRSALTTLIETQDAARVYAPIDISLTFHTLEHLKTRVVRPRILEQFDTDIPV